MFPQQPLGGGQQAPQPPKAAQAAEEFLQKLFAEMLPEDEQNLMQLLAENAPAAGPLVVYIPNLPQHPNMCAAKFPQQPLCGCQQAPHAPNEQPPGGGQRENPLQAPQNNPEDEFFTSKTNCFQWFRVWEVAATQAAKEFLQKLLAEMSPEDKQYLMQLLAEKAPAARPVCLFVFELPCSAPPLRPLAACAQRRRSVR